MSGTTQDQAAAKPVYTQWKADVYKAVGEALEGELELRPKLIQSPKKKVVTKARELPEVTLNGKAAPQDPAGKVAANTLFGSREDRTEISNGEEIGEMYAKGLAAPVEITGKGNRKLRGNFFSVADHNLKESSGEVDTTRPVVLLLTGSGGSAEDQGLDVAKFYAESGASVLSANYAGFGGSDQPEGTPSELSLKQDAQSMLQHLIELGYDPDKIIIHGYSMGAAVAAGLQQPYEAAGTKFRGTVQDRPMLSTRHGAETRGAETVTTLRKVQGVLGRMAVGALDGESAIKRMDGDTPLVITTDKGLYADRADALRTKLKKRGHEVDGARSDRDHFNHQAMLNTNQDALRKVIDGGDEADEPSPYPKDATALVDDCNSALQGLNVMANAISAECAGLETQLQTLKQEEKNLSFEEESTRRRRPPSKQKKKLVDDAMKLLGKVQTQLGELVDVLNYLPELPDPGSSDLPSGVSRQIAAIKVYAANAKDKLPKAATALRSLLDDQVLKEVGHTVKWSRQETDLVVAFAAGFVSDCYASFETLTKAADVSFTEYGNLKTNLETIQAEEKGLSFEQESTRRRRPPSSQKTALVADAAKLLGKVQSQLDDLKDVLKHVADLPTSRDLPEEVKAQVAGMKTHAANAEDKLPKAAMGLWKILNDQTLAEVRIDVACSKQELDLVTARAAGVVDRLTRAGGPATANARINNEVLEVMDMAGLFGVNRKVRNDMDPETQTMFAALEQAAREIEVLARG